MASPPGPAPRAVVRVAGPQAVSLLARVLIDIEAIEGPSAAEHPPRTDDPAITLADRLARLRRPSRFVARLDSRSLLGAIDVDVLLWPTNRGYVGQPAAELGCVGSPAVVQTVLDRFVAEGARIAGRGEFTLRAFLAGNLDLVQAEAVLGVIEADSRAGLGMALDQLTGGISSPLSDAREQMIELLADVEAGLDFVDEDIQFIADDELAERLAAISEHVAAVAARLSSRGRAGDSPLVALRGRPNAGKSRLMNALSGMESSIVSDLVGTTRDPVEVRLPLGGQTLRIVDTAGIEESGGSGIETIVDQAQRLGRSIAERADVRIWCQDATAISILDDRGQPCERHRASEHGGTGDAEDLPVDVYVATKTDRLETTEVSRLEQAGWIATSAVSGAGLERLVAVVQEQLQVSEATAGVAATALRCRETLVDAAKGLAAASETAATGGGHEWIAAELRMALDAVGRVTGEVYTEEILDSIFSRFCIGK